MCILVTSLIFDEAKFVMERVGKMEVYACDVRKKDKG